MSTLSAQFADRLFQQDRLVLSSGDHDEVVESCTKALRPHRLTVRGRGASLATTLHHLPLGSFSLNRLRYGADVVVAPAVPEEDNFLVTLPLSGNARFVYGNADVPVSPGHGAIIGPYHTFRFDIAAAFDQIVLRLNRQRVEALCAALIGSSKVQPVHFRLSLADAPHLWLQLIEAVASLPDPAFVLAHPKLGVPFEEAIINSLLLTLPHDLSDSIASIDRGAPSASVRRAVEYMREHLEEPLRLVDVARHAGHSLRSLQLAFQRDLGTSPSRWLQAQRLEKVHAVLSAAAPGSVTVTEVALQCGFFHLGEFAAHYKARFGKKPSDVLAKKS